MSRDDEVPDPRHARPSSAPLLLLGLLGVFAVVVLAAGVTYVFVRAKAGDREKALRAEEEAARAAERAGPKGVRPSDDVLAVGDAVRAGLNEPMTIDGLAVRVVSVGVGKARVYAADQTMIVEDQQDSMLVAIELRAEDRSRTYPYRTWRAVTRRFAIDDDGVAYAGRLGTFTAEYPGFVSSRSVGGDEKVTDTLVFARPIGAAKYVDLDLPGKNAGVDGVFRFRIPRSAWEKK